MEATRAKEILFANCLAYNDLHIALIESVIDIGAEVISNITEDLNLDETELGLLERLNRSLGWTGFFAGLQSNTPNISDGLIRECIESIETIYSAIIYIEDNRKKEFRTDDFDDINSIKEMLTEQIKNLVEIEDLLTSPSGEEYGFNINKEVFIINRRLIMQVIEEIIGRAKTQEFVDKVNDILPVLREYQEKKKAEIKNKAGS